MEKPLSIDFEKLGVAAMSHLTVRLPSKIVAAIDAAAAQIDPSMPTSNRSLWIRKAVTEKLRRDQAISEVVR